MLEFNILLDRPWAMEWFMLVEIGCITIAGICIRLIIEEVRKGARK